MAARPLFFGLCFVCFSFGGGGGGREKRKKELAIGNIKFFTLLTWYTKLYLVHQTGFN